MSLFPRRHALLMGVSALAVSGCAARRERNVPRFDPPLYPNETPELRGLINKWADHYQIPRELVHRQAIRESTHNPAARNGP